MSSHSLSSARPRSQADATIHAGVNARHQRRPVEHAIDPGPLVRRDYKQVLSCDA